MTTAVCGGSVTHAKMESGTEQIQCTSRIHINGWKNEKNRYNCLKKYNFFNYLNQKEFYTVVLLNIFPLITPSFAQTPNVPGKERKF